MPDSRTPPAARARPRPWALLCLSALPFLSMAAPVRAGDLGFSFGAEKPFGSTDYDFGIAFTQGDPSAEPVRIRSRLEFPLDPLRLGAGIAVAPASGRGDPDRWRWLAGAWTSIGPAFSHMRDRDWASPNAFGQASRSQNLALVSDTRSRTSTWQWGGETVFEFPAFSVFGIPFVPGMGGGGWRADYDLYGYTGKQFDPDSGWSPISGPSDLRVAAYTVWSLYPLASLRPAGPWLGLDWAIRLRPAAYVRTTDDHLLRKKRILIEGWGSGGALEGARRIGKSPWVPYARFAYERIRGKMRQTYYADSPDTPADETGESIGGLSATITAWEWGLGLRWSWD